MVCLLTLVHSLKVLDRNIFTIKHCNFTVSSLQVQAASKQNLTIAVQELKITQNT